MRRSRSAVLVAVLGLGAAVSAGAQTLTFNFDSGTPVLFTGRSTPFEQTVAGVTAQFSSPSGPAFSLQSDSSTGWKLSQFSGRYIYYNDQYRNVLNIRFSQPVTTIAFTFATADFADVEVPTSVQLVAYVDSASSAPVGSATARGTYGDDSMPMGRLSFASGGKPFNFVEIGIPQGQPWGAFSFYVDNVVVTAANGLTFTSVSAASYAAGAPLAPGAIASGFGQGLASAAAGAETTPLPTALANTTVTLKDSAGIEKPAQLFYVSPTQINYLVPDGTAAGPTTLTVTSGTQVTARDFVNIESIAPGLFTANLDGAGAPAAQAVTVAPDLTVTTQLVAQCGASPGSCGTSPIDLGPSGTVVALVLYGTGIRGRSSLDGVTATIGGLNSQVFYAGAQLQYAGLDQVNVVIPRALAGRGEVELALTVDGKRANNVRVNIK